MNKYLIGLVVFAVGCGSNSPPPGAPIGNPSPVSGKITLSDGTPLKGGVVDFHPVENEVGGKLRYDGGSLVDANGSYKAGFNGNGAGLVPGEYIVTVAPRELGELAGSNVKSIPKKFNSKSSSTLKVTILESDNTVNIVLK